MSQLPETRNEPNEGWGEKTYFTRRPKGFSNFHKDMEVRPLIGPPRIAGGTHERSKSVMSYAERAITTNNRGNVTLAEQMERLKETDGKFSDRNLDSIIDRVLQRQELDAEIKECRLERTESAELPVPLQVIQ